MGISRKETQQKEVHFENKLIHTRGVHFF